MSEMKQRGKKKREKEKIIKTECGTILLSVLLKTRKIMKYCTFYFVTVGNQ